MAVSRSPVFVSLYFLGLAAFCLQSSASLPADQSPISSFKSYTEIVPGTKVEFEMVAISGGTFMMGSPTSEKGRGEDEGPQHPVSIRPFWMAKTETTWDLYDLYSRSTDEVKDRGPRAKERGWADAITRPTPPYLDETFGHG